MGEHVTEGAAHGQARDPGVLQPHAVGADGLAHLIHKPGTGQGSGASEPVWRAFASQQVTSGAHCLCDI